MSRSPQGGKTKPVRAQRQKSGATPRVSQPAVPGSTSMPATRAAARFLRNSPLKVIAASAAILVPCFWHAHIAAGDLASHTYNAWLAQLISRGQAPGLYVAKQWSNVLFDFLLSGLTRALGFGLGEKISVSLCVLVFFWGGFALTSAMARRAAWSVAPLLAMLSYGWVFSAGFFNLYLATGLSLWALALVWYGAGWEWALLAPLVLLISRAHQLGIAWIAAAGAYLALARFLPRRWHPLLIGTSVAAYFGIRQGLLAIYQEYPRSPNGLPWLFGGDQLVLYGPVFFVVAIPLMIFAVLAVIASLVNDRRKVWPAIAVSGPLYCVLAVAAFFAPGGLILPQYAAPMNFLPERMTMFAAIVGCCVLAALPVRRWQTVAYASLALVFFSLLCADTARINAMEDKVRTLIAQLPPGERVIATLDLVNCRLGFTMGHVVDRACIGHCFSYANYEPASMVFRIRATPGNRIVTADEEDSFAMQKGNYRMKPEELPAGQMYFCGTKVTGICLQPLPPPPGYESPPATRPSW